MESKKNEKTKSVGTPKNKSSKNLLQGVGQVAKVWIEQTEPDPLGQDYTIKTFSKDLFEFRNSFTTPKHNIFESKLAIFINALGLSDLATGKDVLDVAPNFESIVKLSRG